jgi:serine/threonine-protein kinase
LEGRAPQPDAPLASGTRFGTYRIERLIGAGGMGSVYEALHVGLKKRVAIKILHSAFANNDEVVARFLREGEATSRINHPNVVDVTDLGVKDGIPYLVMELLTGENLAALINREKVLPVDRSVDLLLPMISAVGMAHDEGVVHRDLKPDNIFLAKNRLGATETKLLDFGISKMVTRSELTTAASVLGTPHYLSPEQAQALRDIDGRADQYSLAVILYRLVTGALPVGGGDVVLDVLIAVAQGRVRPPRAVRSDLPEALERVIMRGLATSPKDRYPHTHLMGFDLLPFASDEGRALWRGHFALRVAELTGDVKTQLLSGLSSPPPPRLVPPASVSPARVTPTGAATASAGGVLASGGPAGAASAGAGSWAAAPAGPAATAPPYAGGPSAPPAAGPLVGPSPVSSGVVISRHTPMGGVPVVALSPHSMPVAGPGRPTPAPQLGPAASSGPPGPGGPQGARGPQARVPVGAAQPIGAAASAARPRTLSDAELADTTGPGLTHEERALYGSRSSAGVLAGALVVASIVIVGALWWSSAKDAPVAIPVAPIATYRIHVRTEPAEAELLLDGQRKGQGTLSLELPADAQEHRLEVRAPGYSPESLVFRQGSVPPDVIRLQKAP